VARFPRLTEAQSKQLLRWIEAFPESEDETLQLHTTDQSAHLRGTRTGCTLPQVPRDETFYRQLAALGYLHVIGKQGCLEIRRTVLAYQYARREGMPRVLRRVAHRLDELRRTGPIWIKLFAAIGGIATVVAASLLVRWLAQMFGW